MTGKEVFGVVGFSAAAFLGIGVAVEGNTNEIAAGKALTAEACIKAYPNPEDPTILGDAALSCMQIDYAGSSGLRKIDADSNLRADSPRALVTAYIRSQTNEQAFEPGRLARYLLAGTALGLYFAVQMEQDQNHERREDDSAELDIRSFQPNDAQSVSEVYLRAMRGVYPDLQEGEWSDLSRVNADYINRGGDFLVGIDDDNDIVAVGGLWNTEETTAHILRLCVDEVEQHQGYGTQMYRALEKRAGELGFTILRAAVTAEEEVARTLFEKNGYALTARKQTKHPFGITADTIYYEKTLSNIVP